MKKPSTPARPRARRAARPAAPASSDEVRLDFDPKSERPECVLGAAYLMIDRAYVAIEGDRAKTLGVVLRPKGERTPAALRALEADFRAELEAQRLRWAIARNNQAIREYVAANEAALAEEFAKRPAAGAPEPAADQLTDDQRAEIERLISEVETEIKEMNDKKAGADPKGVAQPWEAGRPESGERGE
ncbi:MAG: hypothetical protein KGM24_12670 [Elusimicrobia bacterium]|nr:hypothetical protein [Elusimicrobiota bacterium]